MSCPILSFSLGEKLLAPTYMSAPLTRPFNTVVQPASLSYMFCPLTCAPQCSNCPYNKLGAQTVHLLVFEGLRASTPTDAYMITFLLIVYPMLLNTNQASCLILSQYSRRQQEALGRRHASSPGRTTMERVHPQNGRCMFYQHPCCLRPES